MFGRIVKESFLRRRSRKVIAIAAVTLGASVATAMLAVAVGVGDKVNRELRSYGANIEALPRSRNITVTTAGIPYQAASASSYMSEDDLPKLKSVFWAHNILAFAPFLTVPVTAQCQNHQEAPADTALIGTWFDHEVKIENDASLVTGIKQVSPLWKVDGRWPGESEALVGARLAQRLGCKPGDRISAALAIKGNSSHNADLVVSGILSTGSDEDNSVIAPLAAVQHLAGLEGKIDRVEVSALTNPEDALARRDPATLTPAEQERVSCTPYPTSVARDVERALNGSEARPVLRISENEGSLLSRVNSMLILAAIAALSAAVLGVASTMMTNILERKTEIGLLKAIGAGNLGVTALFLAESSIIGLCGGVAGLAIGYGLAQVVSWSVFGSGVVVSGVLIPIVLGVSIAIAFAGSALPLRTALRFEPSVVLKGQ